MKRIGREKKKKLQITKQQPKQEENIEEQRSNPSQKINYERNTNISMIN